MFYKSILITIFLIIAAVLSAQNLLNNGDFSSWSEEMPDYWQLSGSSIDAIEETTQTYSSPSSAKLQWSTGTTRYLYQIVDIEPSTQYYCQCWFYDNDAGGRGRIYFTWLDASESSVGSQGSSDYTEDGDQWEKKTYSATSPEDADKVRIELRCYDISGWDGDAEIFVDDCWLNQGDDLLPVTLSSFTAAVYLNQYVSVSWVTQSESNLSHFNIYRDALLVNSQNANNCTSEMSYNFLDSEVVEGETYNYLLEIVELDGSCLSFGPYTITVQFEEMHEEPEQTTPIETDLQGNYPNPFNPDTTISFTVKEGESGRLKIYNVKGQVMLDKLFLPGDHQFKWSADDVQSGIYFYTLQTDNYVASKKMTLLK